MIIFSYILYMCITQKAVNSCTLQVERLYCHASIPLIPLGIALQCFAGREHRKDDLIARERAGVERNAFQVRPILGSGMIVGAKLV